MKWSPHNLLNIDGVHSIDTQEMEPTVFLTRYGVHSFPDERWSQQHLHMRNAIVALLPFPAVRGEAGNDTGH